MTELVINAPHLQTSRQRLGAVALTVAGWLLWCYFFFPLVTLGCWLLDNEVCSRWVNLSGGYLNLQEILGIYAQTIAGLILLWSLWAFYDANRWRREPRVAAHPVSARDLCEAFQVEEGVLKQCLDSRYAIVHFDQRGHIVGLDCG